jgi:peptidyl-prolyl cis-trans isomerase C
MKSMNVPGVIVLIVAVATCPAIILAQTQPQPPVATEPAPIPTDKPVDAPAAAEAPAVTVNGHIIPASEVEVMFQDIIRQQSGGQPVPPELLDQVRPRLAPQIIDLLIDQYLLDEQVQKANVSLSDAEFGAILEELLQGQLLRSGTTRAEFTEQVQRDMGVTVEEFMTQRASDDEFRQAMLHSRFLESKFREEVQITDDAVKSRYDDEKDKVFSHAARVRASHILISTQDLTTDAEKATAKSQAEALLVELRKPDADFAALAAQHSGCPSKTQGGDLGFFANDGSMVAPFADAAFALKPGELSGVVETQFGFHIIKVTERKDARTVSLDDATPVIRLQLKAEKIGALRTQYLADLRKEAKIVYPNQPVPAPASPQPASTGDGKG